MAPMLAPVTSTASAAPAHVSVGFDAADAFRRHYRFVFRTIAAMGVPLDHVDDAVQDVFMTAHRRRADFEVGRPEKGWLFGIARGVARNHRRKVRKRPPALPPSSAGPEHTEPDSQLHVSREVELVKQFLAKLSAKHRDVFVLAHVHGMTAPEIASTVGIKLNTVYSRLRVARQRFEKSVGEHRKRERDPVR
jgi:RNA polymerase sigma factor (sigma-70 family)